MVNLKELKKQQQDKKTVKTSLDDIDDEVTSSKQIASTNWNWQHMVTRSQIYFLQGVKKVGGVAWNVLLFSVVVFIPQLRVAQAWTSLTTAAQVAQQNPMPGYE